MEVGTRNQPYRCPFCGWCYTTWGGLRVRLRAHKANNRARWCRGSELYVDAYQLPPVDWWVMIREHLAGGPLASDHSGWHRGFG